MNRILQSALYSFLFTLFGGSIYYSLGVLMTLAQHGDVVKFFFDTIVACTVLWIFLTFVFYELTGSFERLNRRDDNPGSPKDGDAKKGDPKDGKNDKDSK